MSSHQPTHSMTAGRLRQLMDRTAWFTLLTLAILPLTSGAQQGAPTPSTQVKQQAPAALVTFYSNYISIEGGLPKQKGAAFRGRLFSDDDQVAFMTPGRFLTISFIPGHYTFTANSWAFNTARGGAHLEVDLAAGQHYFIETASRTIPLPSPFSIKQVVCAKAYKEDAHDQPLEAKHISASAAPYVVAETAFPTCP